MKTKKRFIQIRFYWYSLLTNLFGSNHFSKYKLKYAAMLLILSVIGSYNNEIHGNSNENPPSTQDAIKTTIPVDDVEPEIRCVALGTTSADIEYKQVAVQKYTQADFQPRFSGGEAKLREYIDANLKYPQSAKEWGIREKLSFNLS